MGTNLEKQIKVLVLSVLASCCQPQLNCPSAEWLENGDFCYLLVKGASGRTFDEAKADCRGRDSGSDLLWLSSAEELSWLTDYNARQWGIRKDWNLCKSCSGVEAAWIGAYRDPTDGQFKWIRDGLAVDFAIYWWHGYPKRSPADYVKMGDTGSGIRFRTEINKDHARFWHFCKSALKKQN